MLTTSPVFEMPNAIAKSLSRLSRDKLVDLCVSWTKSSKCDPYLALNRNIVETEEEDYLHEPANSRNELSSIYTALKCNGNRDDLAHLSKKDIIDRIVDGDWRRGLSYYQLASIDFAKLEEDDTSLRWTALKCVPFDQSRDESTEHRPSKKRRLIQPADQPHLHYPETAIAVFVQDLKRHISPLVKAHYHIHRLDALKLSVVRLHIQQNVPFAPLSANTPRQGRSAVEGSRAMYIALPDSSPYVYVSISGAVSTGPHKNRSKHGSMKIDLAATKKIVLEAIPKALSRPQRRWSLEPTKLTAKSLRAVCLLRGSGVVGTTGGAFSQITQPAESSETHSRVSGFHVTEQLAPESGDVAQLADRSILVERRFGNMTYLSHASLDQVRIKIEDVTRISTTMDKKRKRRDDDTDQETASVTITLSGSDVFAGLKQFALCHPEYVDMDKLPAAFSGGSQCSVITL